MQSHIVSNHWISIHRVADVAQICRQVLATDTAPQKTHTVVVVRLVDLEQDGLVPVLYVEW